VRDRDWMVPAAILLAVQVVICVCLAVACRFEQVPVGTSYAKTALPFVLFVIGVGTFRDLRSDPERPARERWLSSWVKYRGFVLAMVLFCAQFVVVTWAKSMLRIATSMWADVPLANADAAIFGRDAWMLLPRPNLAVDLLYLSWVPVVSCAFAVLYFSKRPNRNTALLTFFVVAALLETGGQYLLPSGGPIFFQRLGLGDRFASMYQPVGTRHVADLLWQAYDSNVMTYGSGISAFPSMHVSISAWLAITFRNVFVICFAVFIFFASIMLGWHYALDGIAGAAGAAACYSLAKVLVARDWSWKPFSRGASEAAPDALA
jgi:PAP2 superfamily protein